MTDDNTKTEANATDDKDKSVSIVDEARAIRDEIIKAKDELKAENDRTAKLQAENLLGGEAGGNIKVEPISPEAKKVNDAKEFFKGTGLGDAIEKANG